MNLIVGGTGFIGGHLAEYFFKEGEISKGIFRKGSHLRIMDQCGVQCIEADIADRHSLHEPMDMVDVVYNLASPPPGLGEADYARFNGTSLKNLLGEAHEHGAKVFVHLSCVDVYGFGGGATIDTSRRPNPGNAYQRSKLEGEKVVTGFGKENREMKVRIVRAVRPIGPRDPTLTTPLLKMMEGGKVILPAGASGRMSLVHPKDVAQGLLRASTSATDGEMYAVKSFDASVADFAGLLSKTSGTRAELKQQGLLSGKTSIPQYASEQVKAGLTIGEQESWKRISYAPAFTIEQTVEETIGWYRKEPWVTKDLA